MKKFQNTDWLRARQLIPNGAKNLNRPFARSGQMVKVTPAGKQVTQWDVQNKGKSRWTGTSCFVMRFCAM